VRRRPPAAVAISRSLRICFGMILQCCLEPRLLATASSSTAARASKSRLSPARRRKIAGRHSLFEEAMFAGRGALPVADAGVRVFVRHVPIFVLLIQCTSAGKRPLLPVLREVAGGQQEGGEPPLSNGHPRQGLAVIHIRKRFVADIELELRAFPLRLSKILAIFPPVDRLGSHCRPALQSTEPRRAVPSPPAEQ